MDAEKRPESSNENVSGIVDDEFVGAKSVHAPSPAIATQKASVTDGESFARGDVASVSTTTLGDDLSSSRRRTTQFGDDAWSNKSHPGTTACGDAFSSRGTIRRRGPRDVARR